MKYTIYIVIIMFMCEISSCSVAPTIEKDNVKEKTTKQSFLENNIKKEMLSKFIMSIELIEMSNTIQLFNMLYDVMIINKKIEPDTSIVLKYFLLQLSVAHTIIGDFQDTMKNIDYVMFNTILQIAAGIKHNPSIFTIESYKNNMNVLIQTIIKKDRKNEQLIIESYNDVIIKLQFVYTDKLQYTSITITQDNNGNYFLESKNKDVLLQHRIIRIWKNIDRTIKLSIEEKKKINGTEVVNKKQMKMTAAGIFTMRSYINNTNDAEIAFLKIMQGIDNKKIRIQLKHNVLDTDNYFIFSDMIMYKHDGSAFNIQQKNIQKKDIHAYYARTKASFVTNNPLYKKLAIMKLEQVDTFHDYDEISKIMPSFIQTARIRIEPNKPNLSFFHAYMTMNVIIQNAQYRIGFMPQSTILLQYMGLSLEAYKNPPYAFRNAMREVILPLYYDTKGVPLLIQNSITHYSIDTIRKAYQDYTRMHAMFINF